MNNLSWARVIFAVLVLFLSTPSWAEAPKPLDGLTAMYLYHKLSGEPLHIEALANKYMKVKRSSHIDRPDVLEKEKLRIQNEYDQADPNVIFGINLYTNLTYQHEQEGFAPSTFEPGTFIPYGPGPTRGTQYKLNFANVDELRYIPMPKAQAKALSKKFRFHNPLERPLP